MFEVPPKVSLVTVCKYFGNFDITIIQDFCAAQPDDEVVSGQFGMDFMNHPFKPIQEQD